LYCLFSEIMIDAIDLTLRENTIQQDIQCPGRFKIVAKRFLDNYP
jgi:hypothetical protein